MAEFCEFTMMVCFGLSWPVSVYKSFRSRSTGGKSLFFLLLIATGYIVGLAGKLIYNPNYVAIVYCVNLTFVLTDICLYFRNKAYEKKQRVE